MRELGSGGKLSHAKAGYPRGMPYHVRITRRSNRSHDEVKLDLTAERLEEQFLRSYREGRPIVIGGMTIPTDDIERIRINETSEDSDQLLPHIRAERRASRVLVAIPDDWYVADHGQDVTDELITGPPGSARGSPDPEQTFQLPLIPRRSSSCMAATPLPGMLCFPSCGRSGCIRLSGQNS